MQHLFERLGDKDNTGVLPYKFLSQQTQAINAAYGYGLGDAPQYTILG